MKFLITAVLLFFTMVTVVTGDLVSSDERLSSYYIQDIQPEALNRIAEKFEITRRVTSGGGTGFEVIVPAVKSDEFLSLAPSAVLLEADTSAEVRKNYLKSIGSKISYRNFQQVQDTLAQLASQYPNLAQVYEYGRSANGYPLLALKLSDNVTVDEDEPELMLTAATHGDEIITTEILLNLLEKLIVSYGQDSRLTNIVDKNEIYFIPVVNPDGYTRRQRYEGMADPNRSYPYPEKSNVQSTPSISALRDFFHSRAIAGSIDFHAYGEMIMYPWAYTYAHVEPADKAHFHAVTEHMAETNNYKYGPISEVIYVAKGSSADYYYWQKKTKALAVEVGRAKAPPAQQIPAYTEAQAEATWRFLESFN